jgi:hypothetical protein
LEKRRIKNQDENSVEVIGEDEGVEDDISKNPDYTNDSKANKL